MAIRDLIPWKREKTPARQPVVQREAALDPFEAFRSDMDRMLDRFWGPSEWGAEWSSLYPRVDVVETEGEVKVEAELPGLDAEDVQVSVSQNVLSIKGEKKQEREESGKNWYRSERSYGSFQRAISLPQGTDTEQVEATFEKGVLTITFAKTGEGKQAKIVVKAV
jgi:HSP20 family protein